MLTREQLIVPIVPSQTVNVPDLAGDVIVVGLTAAERDAWDAEQYALKEKGELAHLANFRARLVVRCLVDKHGQRLLTDDDAVALGKQSGRIVDRLFDVARDLSGLASDEQEKEAKN